MNISQRMTQQQSLILSPELQQSLSLLQAAEQDLLALVTQFLTDNPLADVDEAQGTVSKLSEEEILAFNDKAEPPADMQWTGSTEETLCLEDISTDLADRDRITRDDTLIEFLHVELSLAGKDTSIIPMLDERGFYLDDLELLSPSQRDALRFIRTLEPKGLGALCLSDCLCLQLDPSSLAYKILQDDEEALARRHIPYLSRKYNVTFTALEDLYRDLKKLSHNPASIFASSHLVTKDPEIFLDKDLKVTIPGERIPNVKVNTYYQDLLLKLKTADKDFIREKIKGVKFFIRAIRQRQTTIRAVTEAIVSYQREFFETYDIAKLKPLTMAQIALVVDLHETTVSRAVNNKYLSTPRGTFELRFFFTSGLSTAAGEVVSNRSVKDQIALIIQQEDKKRPYSDEEIVEILKGTVARRTVAKYRAELNIQPSHLRRTYGR